MLRPARARAHTLTHREVTKNHTINTRRTRSGFSGSIRVQYSFLIPKYPIGTFSIYSCLGNMKFSANPDAAHWAV